MATKEELSEEINEALGTDLEFDRMLVEDLEHFRELAAEGKLAEPQLKQFVKTNGQQATDSLIEEAVENWYPGKYAGKIL